MNESLSEWTRRPKGLAIICDIDETLTVQFDVPIRVGCDVLRGIDRLRLSVHYVTARPPETRKKTEQFLIDHGLPGFNNLNFCPRWQGTRVFKLEQHVRLAQEFQVIGSIGDADEEAEAAQHAGIPFIRVDTLQPDKAWAEFAELLTRH